MKYKFEVDHLVVAIAGLIGLYDSYFDLDLMQAIWVISALVFCVFGEARRLLLNDCLDLLDKLTKGKA